MHSLEGELEGEAMELAEGLAGMAAALQLWEVLQPLELKG